MTLPDNILYILHRVSVTNHCVIIVCDYTHRYPIYYNLD